MGVEPTLVCLRGRCLTVRHQAPVVEDRGVEPRSDACKATVSTFSTRPPYLVAPLGFEPRASGS